MNLSLGKEIGSRDRTREPVESLSTGGSGNHLPMRTWPTRKESPLMIQQRSVVLPSQQHVPSSPDAALTPSCVADVPDDLFQQYLSDIAGLPRLSNGEDDRLLAQLDALKQRQAPDAEGRRIVQQLIEGSLHLVIYLAERYYRYWRAVAGYARVPLPDLIQAGNLALVQCATRCWTEPRTPPDFSAYAAAYIRS